jgi:hypothetical protein
MIVLNYRCLNCGTYPNYLLIIVVQKIMKIGHNQIANNLINDSYFITLIYASTIHRTVTRHIL